MVARTPPGQTRERVYRFVRDRLLAGRPPTMREVQRAMGFKAVESARSHLNALVEEGRLRKQDGKARGYSLPDSAPADDPPVQVPLLGQVPAGPLNLAVEDVERYLPVRSKFRGAELFALRVEGDSMRDAGILDGDLLAVHRTPEARNGQLVVARLGDEVTVKRFERRGRRVRLLPANPDFEPIEVDLARQELEIEGIGVGVLRNGEAL